MSGHSKWATIKRQKGITDARRGNIFTKLSREITLAARQGGGDPAANFRLRLAVQKARDQNMPHDNIERAIKRASGGAEGAQLAEITLEGYGPSGVAILVQVLTDNRLRTLQDVRSAFSRQGGSLGESGSVAWLFHTRGVLTIDADRQQAEEIALKAIDAGADDVNIEKSYIEIYTSPQDLEKVRRALEESGLKLVSAEVSLLPKSTVELEEKAALQTLKLLDRLEEMDDVQRVFSNIDYSEEVLEKLRAQA